MAEKNVDIFSPHRTKATALNQKCPDPDTVLSGEQFNLLFEYIPQDVYCLV